MKADAADADAQLQKLKQAGSEFLDGVERRPGRIAQGFRPRQSGRVGRIQTRRASDDLS